jgi:hypothetical protein
MAENKAFAMQQSIITICFLAVGIFSCSSRGAESEMFPFQSVILSRNTIIATLPASKRWIVEADSAKSRMSEPGESFTLHAGSSLRLIEKHSNYLAVARLTPTAGLQIESIFDARSFGSGVAKKNYFIPAR